jgi:hypothetical protein
MAAAKPRSPASGTRPLRWPSSHAGMSSARMKLSCLPLRAHRAGWRFSRRSLASSVLSRSPHAVGPLQARGATHACALLTSRSLP